MKEKILKKKIVIPAVLVVIAGICIACVLWIRTPGIHFLFGLMHADVKEKCYIYDVEKDEFLGQTEVMIRGRGNGITKKFRGEMSVDGYGVEGADGDDSFPIDREGIVWRTMYVGYSLVTKKDEEGNEYAKPKRSKFFYFLYVNTRNSDEFCLAVAGGDESFHVIHAASEKEARQVFEKLLTPVDEEKILLKKVLFAAAVLIIFAGICIACILWLRMVQ